MVDLERLQHLVSELGSEVTKTSQMGLGEPEEQLRAPIEALLTQMADELADSELTLVGETALGDVKVRPDYAALVENVLIGHIEVKAPGKGADPTRFRDAHDKRQWERLATLPNVLYTDGNEWGLYREGERVGGVVDLDGNVDTDGSGLSVADTSLAELLDAFFSWTPIAPRSAKQLAVSSARLCRLLRQEVAELMNESSGLKSLQSDWRDLLYPTATNEEFADQYAQTVTFALLLARVEGVDFGAVTASGGRVDLSPIASALRTKHGLMATALSVLTSENVLKRLATSVRTLVRMLSVVDWEKISKRQDAWLLFYEEFLGEYDPALRQSSGSYYTPNPVVTAMIRMADELLVERLGKEKGFAEPSVTVVDPACGTGTFPFRIIERIASTIKETEGEGAVGPRLEEAAKRLVGFELQAGPYSVAELRLAEEFRQRGANLSDEELRLYVANTLDDPYTEQTQLGGIYEAIARSRREANHVKAEEDVMVVIGNPPYKEKSKGDGGWVEAGSAADAAPSLLSDWVPPKEWKLSAHVKHLYNPYVYFWRWASWKVFESSQPQQGIVSFITVAGFLDGPGFSKMRDYLRRTADEIWVMDLSPEGYQPDVPTRVFQGVQQPICIVTALRDGSKAEDEPAKVNYRLLEEGHRSKKFLELSELQPTNAEQWTEAASEWRAPFRPAGSDEWLSFPALSDVFPWSGSGTMPGRTWVIAPDKETLNKRWQTFIGETDAEKKSAMLKRHDDRTLDTRLSDNLWGYDAPATSLGEETSTHPPIEEIGYRSFDKQFLIADKRVINRPNPSLWYVRGDKQLFLTLLDKTVPKNGPAVTATYLVPDLDHYKGSFGGRAVPLWRDPDGTQPNVLPGLVELLAERLGFEITPEDLFAYIMGVIAHSGFTDRLLSDLETAGLRIPLTASANLFNQAVALGTQAIDLHTRGARFGGAAKLLEAARKPKVVDRIPSEEGAMPDSISYDPATQSLSIGKGIIAPVEQVVVDYEISGTNVLRKWFGYRSANPEGKRSSPLDNIAATKWTAEYTSDLLKLIETLTRVCDLEDEQSETLDAILAGNQIGITELEQTGLLQRDKSGALGPPPTARRKPSVPKQASLDLGSGQ